jgi:PKD repeat protein
MLSRFRDKSVTCLTLLFFLIIFVSGFLFASCSGAGGGVRNNDSDNVNQDPTADFIATPTIGMAPLEVSLDASTSSDPEGVILPCDWDYGDGSTDSGVFVAHTYTTDGIS